VGGKDREQTCSERAQNELPRITPTKGEALPRSTFIEVKNPGSDRTGSLVLVAFQTLPNIKQILRTGDELATIPMGAEKPPRVVRTLSGDAALMPT
jgi:hypothetical protein